jgi:hypothetical protein
MRFFGLISFALAVAQVRASVFVQCTEHGVHPTSDVFDTFTVYSGGLIATNGCDLAIFDKSAARCYVIHDGSALTSLRIGEAADTQSRRGATLEKRDYLLAHHALFLIDELERKKRTVAGFVSRMGATRNDEENEDLLRLTGELQALQSGTSTATNSLCQNLRLYS